MSEHADSHERVEAIAEQLELSDLAVQNEEADQVRGGQATAPAPQPPPRPAFEIKDWSFNP